MDFVADAPSYCFQTLKEEQTTVAPLSPHLQAGQPPTTTTEGWMMA